MRLYFYTCGCILAKYGKRQNIPARTDPATGDGGEDREPGGIAQAAAPAEVASDAGHAFAGSAGIEAGENARRLQGGLGASGGDLAGAAAGAGSERIPAGYPARGEHAGIENTAERSAATGRGRRR